MLKSAVLLGVFVIKRALFLLLVRVDIRVDIMRYEWGTNLLIWANEKLWADYDGQGTGGESFWEAVW